MPNYPKKRPARKQRAAQKKFRLRRPKQQVVRGLAAIAETKSFCGWHNAAPVGIETIYVGDTSAGTVFVPNSYMFMQRARDLTGENVDFGIEGNSIFSKYLTMKLNLEYPFGADAPQVPCRPVEMVWGWVNPMNLTDRTTPTETTVSRAEIIEHVNDAIGSDFDSASDDLLFNKKRKRIYNIVGRQQLMPNINKQLPAAIPAGSWAGHSAPLHRAITWRTMKKLRFSRTIDADAPVGDAKPFSYPVEAYIPFMILYNKDYASYNRDDKNSQKIKVSYNTCHWFNDM